MISFPNAKINLGLQVLRKRPDGFHDLDTVFYPIAIRDALEIITLQDAQEIKLTITGTNHIGDASNNTCTKAYTLLKKDYPSLPPVHIHLHKTIPAGAGMGGGSADGAFTLMLLNRKFNLQISEEALLNYAAALGSDCAFFIKNKPCFATGRGEVLEDIPGDLSSYKIVVVHPGIHVSTADAFRDIKTNDTRPSVKHIVMQPVKEWRNLLSNDFETTVFESYPAIRSVKEKLYDAGALYASMTGSGSAVYGIFEKDANPGFDFPVPYFVRVI